MFRFEDQGLTLRLFADQQDAMRSPDAIEASAYGPGAIAKDASGRWFDAHGLLPIQWAPDAKLMAATGERQRGE